ncbi:hypothetical protein DDI_1184 [Dickeya dianthicola RNS04.9]|nr:hypothetical protein DDI_1184 [Dickeya dianthicola RNS04.9]
MQYGESGILKWFSESILKCKGLHTQPLDKSGSSDWDRLCQQLANKQAKRESSFCQDHQNDHHKTRVAQN